MAVYISDTMWDFLIRRAESELISKGLGTKNSPIEINENAKAYLIGLKDELRKFYRTLGRNLTDQELALEIERRYGEQILKEVCIPHGLYAGACLLIAMEVAKESENDAKTNTL